MKKILLSAGLLLSLASINAFGQSYAFSKRTEAFSELVGGTSLTTGTIWDNNQYTVPLGFDFNFYGKKYSSVKVDSDGRFWFGSGLNNVIYGYAESVDLVDRGMSPSFGTPQSPIRHQTIGTAPNRIFKVEYKNVGFWPATTTDRITFQIWLYENKSDIEIHYGDNVILNSNTVYAGNGGPTVGVRSLQKNMYLIGTNLSATSIVNSPTLNVYMSGTPLQHTVYKFAYDGFIMGAKEEEVSAKSLTVYPNPTTDNLTIELPTAKTKAVTVFNIIGNRVYQKAVTAGTTTATIDLALLKAGIYVVQVEDAEGQKYTRKITKL